jgi:hypothetical protein
MAGIEVDVSLEGTIRALTDEVKALHRRLEQIYAAVPLFNMLILSATSVNTGPTLIAIPSPPRGVLREIRRLAISTASPVNSVTALVNLNAVTIDGAVGATPMTAGYSRGEFVIRNTDFLQLSVSGVPSGLAINVGVLHWDVPDQLARVITFP